MMGHMAKRIAVGVLVLLLAIPAAGFFLWLTLGGGAWLSDVEVLDATRLNTGEVDIGLDSCNGSARLKRIETIDDTVIVQVEAFSTPLSGSDACSEILVLGSLPGVTTLRDLTSGQEFEIAG